MPPEPGVGHWHVSVDDKYAGLAVSGALAIPNDTLPVLAAGQHTIAVTLHQNNHAAFDPPVMDQRTISVEQAISVAVRQDAHAGLSPATGDTVHAMPVTGTATDTMVLLTVVLVCLLSGCLLVHLSRGSGH